MDLDVDSVLDTQVNRPSNLFAVWWLAARPKTLLAAVVPVMLGAAIAFHDGVFRGERVLVALLGALLIQVGTNFFNDWADARLGADTEARKGPARAVASGWVRPGTMLVGTGLVFGLALGCAALMTWWAGWPMLVIGLVSVACGFWYTAGRWSLAYLGLGEVFVVLFFGLVAVGGTYFVQAERLPTHAWVSGFAPGFLATALIAVNNWRDIEEDRVAGKRTLAARLGYGFAAWEFVVCVWLGCAVPLVVFAWMGAPGWLLGMSALLLGLPMVLGRGFRTGLRGRVLIPFLGKTALALLVVGVVFSLGWILWRPGA